MNPYDFYITPEEYEQAAANGISAVILEVRVRNLGWTKERALTETPQKKRGLKGEWMRVAEQNGICYSTFRYRVNQLGWDMEKAATQPLQDRKAQAKAAYEASRKYPKELKDLAESNGISERTFHRRIDSGWDIQTAATKPIMTHREIGLLTKDKRLKGNNRFFPRQLSKLVATK